MSNSDQDNRNVYLVGSGVASLASAVFLIEEAGVSGKNIHILEQDSSTGGCLDGALYEGEGYLIRGGRMHEKHFGCYWDLLSRIPSRTDPAKSVTEESFEFNKKFVTNAQARLLRDGEIVDLSSFSLSTKHKFELLKLLFQSEESIEVTRIEDWYSDDFFQTNFWLLWSTMFAFQKWSSVMEMRRYFIRFMHLLPGFSQLGGILRTVYNQHDSVVIPINNWLKAQGVNYCLNTRVTDIDFEFTDGKKTATHIQTISDEEQSDIILDSTDYVFITNGSIVESSDVGTMAAPPKLKNKSTSGSWMLWEKIASKHSSFGKPGVFCDQIALQKWESFTVTLRDPTFFQHIEEFTGNVAGTGGLITMTDSNWLISVVLAAQPHFADQPEDVQVFWGYGLYPDRVGNYVKKKMSECTGFEILTELFSHLKITAKMQETLDASNAICLPVMMPFIDSLFMPRKMGDRPQVIPEGATNFAFLGQFTEIPRDCVFTVEYSVRSAMMAVYGHFCPDKNPPPVYGGAYNPITLINAIKSINT